MRDFDNKWNHRWITSKAESFNSSIEGIGVVSIENISKGEVVGVLGGVIVPTSEIENYREKQGHIGIQIDDDFFICPTSRDELEETGAFNHSCNPNVGFKNLITLVAIKDIRKGEELVFDYAFCESHFEPFTCKCGSKNCRKIIKQTDWKLEKLREKYGEYFSPYLKEKFK